MAGKNSDEVLNMRQRTVLQYLNVTDWRLANRFPVSAGEMTLSRLVHRGWIEIRRENQHIEVRLAPRGSRQCEREFEAIRRPVELG